MTEVDPVRPLAGVRVIEVSMLGPAATTVALGDLGADVVKVEPPQGDYSRQMTWPMVDGVSLLYLHVNRGKRSVVLDLNTEGGKQVFEELVRSADAVVEAMRPGGLERRGLGFERLREINPRIVFVTISGYGMTGPFREYPSHGIAYDTWAGIVGPQVDDEGFTFIPEHTAIGINVAPLYGALAILAGILQARETGAGMQFDVAQSDAAAATDWLRSETYRAYERPESEVTGNPTDDYERRPPATAGMKDAVRYQFYESADGHVLFMASEQAFWRNFCEAVDRMDLYERWPGRTYADHARGNTELRAVLRDLFRSRTSAEWLELGGTANTPIAPVNTPKTIADDPQFHDRMEWIPASSGSTTRASRCCATKECSADHHR